MKMDSFKYTRHILIWLVSTLFFFTVISADYVDVQVVPLVICLFAPFLFEPSSINPKTKWTIDLAIIAVSVCAILFTQTYRIAFTYSEITYLLISLIVLIFVNSVISHKGFTKKNCKIKADTTRKG